MNEINYNNYQPLDFNNFNFKEVEKNDRVSISPYYELQEINDESDSNYKLDKPIIKMDRITNSDLDKIAKKVLELQTPNNFSDRNGDYKGKIFCIKIQPDSSNPYLIKNILSVTIENNDSPVHNNKPDNHMIKIKEKFDIQKVLQLTLFDGLGWGFNSYVEYRYKFICFELLEKSNFTDQFILSFINKTLNKQRQA
jgi:hypothetical protein